MKKEVTMRGCSGYGCPSSAGFRGWCQMDLVTGYEASCFCFLSTHTWGGCGGSNMQCMHLAQGRARDWSTVSPIAVYWAGLARLSLHAAASEGTEADVDCVSMWPVDSYGDWLSTVAAGINTDGCLINFSTGYLIDFTDHDTQMQREDLRFSRASTAGWILTVCSSLDPGCLFSNTEHMQIDNRPMHLDVI